MFFNASDSRLSWLTKEGISDTISCYPNQIRFLSPNIKEKMFNLLFFNDEFPFGIFPYN